MAAAHKNDTQAATLVLRLGLAFIFAYAGISSFFNPLIWTGYLPSFIGSIVPAVIAVQLMAVVEVGLAIWLVSGAYPFYAAIASTVLLAGITAVNVSVLFITFRDVGLVAAALALVFLSRNKK